MLARALILLDQLDCLIKVSRQCRIMFILGHHIYLKD